MWAGGPSPPPCGQLKRCFSAVAELLVRRWQSWPFTPCECKIKQIYISSPNFALQRPLSSACAYSRIVWIGIEGRASKETECRSSLRLCLHVCQRHWSTFALRYITDSIPLITRFITRKQNSPHIVLQFSVPIHSFLMLLLTLTTLPTPLCRQ